MAKRGYIPTTQEIRRLAAQAEKGDPDAAQRLGDLNNRLAKRANERMRDIERKGLAGTGAYNRAKYWLQEEADFSGNDYFSQSRKLSPEDAEANLEAITDYLRSQTSTAAGEKRRRQSIGDKLYDKGFFDYYLDELPDEADKGAALDDMQKKLMQMFDTDAWDDIRKQNKGGTNALVAEAVDALSQGALIGDLKRAFRDFQRGADTDYIEMWDNWISASQYYKSGSWHELKRARR